ncbi:hypothetical protein TPHV1_480002 [Treponema phagedenis]|uniref:Uncharacterized protein n=1 Tax=Treponema phagedenis TaxID=162 RepID=A0A0B7GW56_TREPH|nr:hypothetical protein [Treponema phagedenis]CEM62738.1 hypothetical protein TPHV1_480002 [Treponema phagedenis]
MKEIAKEINAITGQSLIMISQSTGKARIDVEASIEAAHKLAERKQADLEHNKKVLNQLEAAEQELTERVKNTERALHGLLRRLSKNLHYCRTR